MNKKFLKLVFSFCLIVFLSFFHSVFAQGQKLELEYPEIGGIKPETVTTALPEYVKYVFNLAIATFGLVVLSVLLWGGFLYLTSAGKPEKLKEAKDRIVSAFLGLIVLLSSYIILTTINPQLVIFPALSLTPLKITEIPKTEEIKPEKPTLITTEIPLGQTIENGLWQKERRTDTQNLIQENENFLTEKITVDDKEWNSIAGLNKYLKSLTEDCHCEELKGLCTKPKNFSQPVGCSGDPCPKETREKIKKVLEINREKITALTEFSYLILEKKADFEKQLAVFQNVEQELTACQTQTKLLFDLNEHLSRLNFFREQGWGLETVKIPGAPQSKADPLTFYCSIGGTIFDYPYASSQELPPEMTVPETTIKETEALSALGTFSCPVEIPLGEIIDQFRESAVLLITKLKKLADLHTEMSLKIEKMEELVSQCNDTRCDINCSCVSNPCYEPACGTPPARVNKCGTGKCTKPTPYTPNFCYWFCDSPCLQTAGGCHGEPCPRENIATQVEEVKQTEDEILQTIDDIQKIFPVVSELLGETGTDPKNLKNLRQGFGLCYSPQIEEPTWTLFACQAAIGNYGPSNQIIGDCHPRNFFCCSLSGEKIKFAWATPPPPSEPGLIAPSKKYPILTESEGCPQGWLCDPDVKNYNQYKDASEPLKELLSCMRANLDKIQKEEELKTTIGRISSISDSKLYPPIQSCSWSSGELIPAGCSHEYEVKYGKERISCHYGGVSCRLEKKSYAVDFGDEENSEYLIEAAKECSIKRYILPEYNHLHISIGQGEGCACQ